MSIFIFCHGGEGGPETSTAIFCTRSNAECYAAESHQLLTPSRLPRLHSPTPTSPQLSLTCTMAALLPTILSDDEADGRPPSERAGGNDDDEDAAPSDGDDGDDEMDEPFAFGGVLVSRLRSVTLHAFSLAPSLNPSPFRSPRRRERMGAPHPAAAPKKTRGATSPHCPSSRRTTPRVPARRWSGRARPT